MVLIVVGHLVRETVDDSPVFQEMQLRKQESSAPLGQLFQHNAKQVTRAALIFAADNAAGCLVIAFLAACGANALGMARSRTPAASLIGGVGWLVFAMFGGWTSDRTGLVRTVQIGCGLIILWAVRMWFLTDTASLPLFASAVVILTVGLGPSYGPQPALYAEMYPARVRCSGVSVGYALGSNIGGAFAPMIAQLLLNETGRSWTIGVHIAALALVPFVAVSLVAKNIQEIDLRVQEVHGDYVAEHPEAAGILAAPDSAGKQG